MYVPTTAVLVDDTQPVVVFLDCAYTVLLAVVIAVSIVDEPVLTNVPAVKALYQSIASPAPGVAPNLIVPAPHIDAGTPVGANGNGLTTIITIVLLSDKQLDVKFLPSA